MSNLRLFSYAAPMGGLIGWTGMDVAFGRPFNIGLVCIVVLWLVVNACWDIWHFDE